MLFVKARIFLEVFGGLDHNDTENVNSYTIQKNSKNKFFFRCVKS